MTSQSSIAKFEKSGQVIHVGLAEVPKEAKDQLDIFKQIISIDKRTLPGKAREVCQSLFKISEEGELNILKILTSFNCTVHCISKYFSLVQSRFIS